MTILIFIIVLAVLVLVHELGHFIVAKLAGMRVDEFGLGYPPRAATLATIGETKYTLNWIPFGGFVKIHGEDDPALRDKRSFASRPRPLQAFVLVAGVTMNIVLAYIFITAGLMAGTPRALAPEEIVHAHDVQLAIAGTLPNSPAAAAGIMPGDLITTVSSKAGHWESNDPEGFTTFVSHSNGNPLLLIVDRDGTKKSITITPVQHLISNDPERVALGVEVATVGIVPLSLLAAITEGASLTWSVITLTAEGLLHFFASIFTFSANLSQVAGPVGIAGVVGSASAQGFGSLLSIMAVISINLALINLIPIPALDGGRLLFVIIESITRRPIKPAITQALNGISFALLLLLMVVITVHDIFKIVG